MNDFFAKDTYIVNQKVTLLSDAYAIEDNNGNAIGQMKEKVSMGARVLRHIMSKKSAPFAINLEDMDGNLLAKAEKSFSLMKATINVTDNKGLKIATIKEKYTIFKAGYDINDPNGNLMATINGDWKDWEFSIKDPNKNEIGTISKKFELSIKEIFTDADKYAVSINESVKNENLRIAILIASGIVDKITRDNNK